MSKRRKRNPLFAIALLLALGVAAAAAWHAAGGRLAWPGGKEAHDQPASPLMACAVLDATLLASRLTEPTTATGTPVPDGVPASGACELLVAGKKLALVRFDGPSLARLRPPIDPQSYFDSLAVGLEYEFKAEPESVAGLGARALAGGFDASGEDPAQVVWQRGGVVFVLAAREQMPRERMLSVARAIDATAP